MEPLRLATGRICSRRVGWLRSDLSFGVFVGRSGLKGSGGAQRRWNARGRGGGVMLRSPLALVLGAGSSRDFGSGDQSPFPLGDDLRLQIARSLNITTDDWGQDVTRGSRLIHSAYGLVSRTSDDPAVKVGNLIGT